MAKYREISEAEVAVGAPITQQLMHAIKDNMLAYREGDATAQPVSYKALQSVAEPTAGEVIIAQSSFHLAFNVFTANQGNYFNPQLGTATQIPCCFIRIKRKGTYRVKLSVRAGSETHENSDDGNEFVNTAKVESAFSREGQDSEAISSVLSLSSGNRVEVAIDKTLEEGDLVYIRIEETNFDNPVGFHCSAVLSIGVSDTNAIWGVDAQQHFYNMFFVPVGVQPPP